MLDEISRPFIKTILERYMQKKIENSFKTRKNVQEDLTIKYTYFSPVLIKFKGTKQKKWENRYTKLKTTVWKSG